MYTQVIKIVTKKAHVLIIPYIFQVAKFQTFHVLMF